jgi:RNA polymerase sigma-70 factor (ECF subfamily)
MDLYQRYGPALLRKAERILQHREDARDIVQELFVEMLEQERAEVDLPYLYRAVTNRCLNHIRNRNNHARLLKERDGVLRGPIRTRCDDQLIGIDLLIRLARRLDNKCSEVLIYRYFDDMTQDEIASFLRTSRKTIGKRLQKIREQVKVLLPEPDEVTS